MFENLSLEEKIKLKTRISQLLFFFITVLAVFGILRVKNTGDDLWTWVVLVFLMSLFCIVESELMNKWLLRTVSDNIFGSISRTSSASDQIIKETNQQEDIVYSHIRLLKDCVERLDKLRKISLKTKESALLVAEKSKESMELSGREQKSVETNIEKMTTLKQKIEIIADLILELSEHIQQIGSIIGVVEDITEQTNMLALNAAVEAARAGEHGKGFAVVAGEIRKLADESKQATTKITSLIHDIQQATNSTVMATEEGTKEIESGVGLAHKIAQNIESLRLKVQETSASVDQIVNDADSQIDSVTETHGSITRLNEGLVESAEKIKQNLLSLNELLKNSESLKDAVVGVNYR
jgi:methyl-accepting chemotaxis protein